MNNDICFKGTRWFKCDLHIHTTSSSCFVDQLVTPKEWVDKAIEKGLDCVAITDHNTGFLIDDIKKASEGTGLTVFPGVEITCDTSKIHLLILFDTSKTTADIRDFLVRVNIPYTNFGKKEASSPNSIFDIISIAHEDGALVIPAHIDEYNGLGSMSNENLKKLFSEFEVNGVQIVNEEFLNQALIVNDNEELKKAINRKYNNPNPEVDYKTLKEWYSTVKIAIDNNVSLLTFSDNPNGPLSSKHGLSGIGNHFTWIKMEELPSLEGLRQALLLPEYRIRNFYQNNEVPYILPELWIKSILVKNTTITDDSQPLRIDFSPQLNTLIGGRGSGKSSILRFIRGVFNRTSDIKDLAEIFTDHTDFYKREEVKTKKGVLTESSFIEIEFVRNNVVHKVTATEIHNSNKQTVVIERLRHNGCWEQIEDIGYIDFLNFDHYSQKQIYDIAKEPNALRERIDNAITGMEELKQRREQIKVAYLEKSAEIRTIDMTLERRGRIETNINDLNVKIEKLQQSKISDIIITKEKYEKEYKMLQDYLRDISANESKFDILIQEFKLPEIILTGFENKHNQELLDSTNDAHNAITLIQYKLVNLKDELVSHINILREALNKSLWKNDFNQVEKDFNVKKIELEQQGIDVISSFERFTEQKNKFEKELKDIDSKYKIKKEVEAKKEELAVMFFSTCNEITEKRCQFVNNNLRDVKVKVEIKRFRNQSDFENKLRKIIQRENTSFQPDIDEIVKICFKGNIETQIEKVRGVFRAIRSGETTPNFTSSFIRLVNNLNESQIDEIELLLPEDDIQVSYKTNAMKSFKSLSSASAGQKTTAILTFILSFGNNPLILDQPEDDLDNRLIYELIVDRLKKSKEHRQIIIVTHNANIPVNGDAEYIVSMDSESKTLKVLYEGTVEQDSIKKEICDVMEGGDKAFAMRSKRYKA